MESEPASDYLVADLEASRVPRWRKALRWIGSLAMSALGDVPDAPDVDLVVRRIDTGAEVLRTHADIGTPEMLLATVRADLDTKTVQEFVAEWRLP